MNFSKIDTSKLNFHELSSLLDQIYLSDPRLKPNPNMHDYQLTYPPAVLLEKATEGRGISESEFSNHVLGDLKNIAFYFHFGFCVYKCRYCHHYELKTNAKYQQMEDYVDSMLNEMRCVAGVSKRLKKLIYFVGGGTPTALPANLIEKFLCGLQDNFGDPASKLSTVEVKPVTASDEKLKLFTKFGFKRINLGVQTLDPELYKLHHHGEDIAISYDAIKRSRAAGFDYINIDILTGLENQTQDSWNKTLNEIEMLIETKQIDSVFIYPYHDDPRSKTFNQDSGLPSIKEVAYTEVLARKMFERLGWSELGTRFFRSPRHRRQEIKDFLYTRANPSYGEIAYHGFGNSSFSVGDKATYINFRDMPAYSRSVEDEGFGVANWETLNNAQRATRDLTFDLLYSPIVRVRAISKKYGKENMRSHISQLDTWTSLGLGKWNRLFGVWRLTKLGKLVHQQMISALYLEKESLALNDFMKERLLLGRSYRGY